MNETYVRDPFYADYVAGKAPFPNRKIWVGWLFLATLWSVLLLPIIVLGAIVLYRDAEFVFTGVDVQARIIETGVISDDTNYYFRVRYPAIDDHNYESVVNIDGVAYSGYAVGDAFPIIYLAGQLETVRTSDVDLGTFAIVLTGVAFTTFVWMGGLFNTLNFTLFDTKEQKRLAEQGVKLLGAITSLEWGTYSEGGLSVQIHYTFQTPTGTTLNGSCSPLYGAKPILPVSGQPIAIQYVDDRLFKVL
jgi:hypothetical protein